MVFSSNVFLFFFLPGVLGLYFVLRPPARNVLLLAASLLFYAWGEGGFVVLMLMSSLLNYVFGLLIDRYRGGADRAVLVVAVAANLGFLAWFKYAHFLFANINAIAVPAGLPVMDLAPIHLPIGISFFTFQAISYVADVYRGQSPVQKNPFNVALYIALFPQLIAGPIVRFNTIASQIVSRRITGELFASGIRRFIVGLGKKVLIANTLAVPADRIFAIPADELSFAPAWLGAACYTLQIYFDFSGYSDMAIGLGRMFGFRFEENFRYPYVARTMTGFWRRWHISLSTWFRDYLYIPLGGNRAGAVRTYRNLLIVFFLVGLWHGASWTFVVWGLYHGAFLVLERAGRQHTAIAAPAPLGHLYVLITTIVGWVLFRSPDFSYAAGMLGAMAGLGSAETGYYFLELYLEPTVLIALAVGVIASTPVLPWLSSLWDRRRAAGALEFGYRSAQLAALIAVFVGSAMLLSSQAYNPFIYFRF